MAQVDIDYKGCLIVVAIGLSLVVIGAVADFLVRKREIKWLHSKFLKLSEALTEIPLREWQVKIARVGIHFVESVQKFGLRCLVFPDEWFKSEVQRLSPLNADKWSLIIYMCLIFTTWGHDIIWGDTWLMRAPGVLVQYLIPPICLVMCWRALVARWDRVSKRSAVLRGTIAWFIIVQVLLDRFCDVSDWILLFPVVLLIATVVSIILRKLSRNVADMFMNTLVISVLVSALAFIVAYYYMPRHLYNSYWYVAVNGLAEPKGLPGILLYCINFPFDLVTIVVSILLLRYVIKHKRFIGLVAVADIVVSAFLTLVLKSFILLIQNEWDILHFRVYYLESVYWFTDNIIVMYMCAKHNYPILECLWEIWGWSGEPDGFMLPILLTTFVPVFLYMSVFILISFCKPVLKLASRIFGAVGEKEESVFKQFGFLIAAIMAAVKAIYEVLTLQN